MKPGIHPDYHLVVFRDAATGNRIMTRSTATSGRTVEWSDGNTYPLLVVDVTNESPPAWPAPDHRPDTAGRAERFERRHGTRSRRARWRAEVPDLVEVRVDGVVHRVPRRLCAGAATGRRGRGRPALDEPMNFDRSTRVTPQQRACERPFTVFVCTGCATEPVRSVLAQLRAAVRRCPHGVLVTTGCVRGPFTCAAGHGGRGAMVVLQPCARDRAPRGPAIFVGPIDSDSDPGALRSWVERGEWDVSKLPERLRAQHGWVSRSVRVN